jgi:hypothetical protein
LHSQERIERSNKISTDLASGRMSVPASFANKPSGTITPEDTPRSKFHIRGYKGHIAGAVHLCGESFSRISEKALQGKHVETLCVPNLCSAFTSYYQLMRILVCFQKYFGENCAEFSAAFARAICGYASEELGSRRRSSDWAHSRLQRFHSQSLVGRGGVVRTRHDTRKALLAVIGFLTLLSLSLF